MTTAATSSPRVVVLGAAGRLGRAATRAFSAAGWHVLAQARRPLPVDGSGVTHVPLALDATEKWIEAARGARAVLHAINPPYPRWQAEAPAALRSTIRLAEGLDATLLFPGNTYNFGERMPPVLAAETAQSPTTSYGRLRVELERTITEHPTLRSVILRAGDFFGEGTGSWFDKAIVRSVARGTLVYPGPLDKQHAWAYVPDLARAFVAVAARTDLPRTSSWHFGGYALTGAELLDAIESAARSLGILAGPARRRSLPWGAIRAGALVSRTWRAFVELSHLWVVPHRLDGAALDELIGSTTTPLGAALEAALRDLVPRPTGDQTHQPTERTRLAARPSAR